MSARDFEVQVARWDGEETRGGMMYPIPFTSTEFKIEAARLAKRAKGTAQDSPQRKAFDDHVFGKTGRKTVDGIDILATPESWQEWAARRSGTLRLDDDQILDATVTWLHIGANPFPGDHDLSVKDEGDFVQLIAYTQRAVDWLNDECEGNPWRLFLGNACTVSVETLRRLAPADFKIEEW